MARVQYRRRIAERPAASESVGQFGQNRERQVRPTDAAEPYAPADRIRESSELRKLESYTRIDVRRESIERNSMQQAADRSQRESTDPPEASFGKCTLSGSRTQSTETLFRRYNAVARIYAIFQVRMNTRTN